MVLGLLAGGLVSLLLLNTVLQQGSFALENMRTTNATLTDRAENLEKEVAYESSPEMIAQKARTLGMRPSTGRRGGGGGKDTAFLDPDTGKVYGGEHGATGARHGDGE